MENSNQAPQSSEPANTGDNEVVNSPVINSVPENPAQLPSAENKPNPKIHHRLLANKKLLIPLVLLLLLLAGAAVYWFVIRDNTQQSPKAETASSAAAKKSELPPPTIINGNTYFKEPQALADLNFFKDNKAFDQDCDNDGKNCKPAFQTSDVKYYQIGTTKDGRKIIMVRVPADGPGGASDYFALQKSDGSFAFLLQMNQYADSYKSSLAASGSLDSTTKLSDVSFPVSVTVGGQKLKTYAEDGKTTKPIEEALFMPNGIASIRGGFRGDLDPGVTPQKLETQGNVTYYRLVPKQESNFDVVEIYGVFNNLFSVQYNPAGELASSSDKLAINWAAGEKNSSTYFSGGQGCSTSGYVIAKNISSSDLINVGKSANGQAIYQLSTGSPLVQELFNKDYAGGQYLNDEFKNLNIQQFSDKHAYFIAQNGLNENMLFQRDDFFQHGGCAKPVIYLYPKVTTKVSVKIGAQVTKSEPTYEDGWRNVTARPNGLLSYKGQSYPNLFWEGYGYGAYPEINSGIIVKSADALGTTKSQLAQQGLKASEINDFMTYWAPKLATTKPYMRITWFGTADMNRLAPLSISPVPQTVIRVFMDSEPLDQAYDLPAQKLTAAKRDGFTVVEWGGLLRGGLN
jgi:hypothetical protein